MYLGKVIGTVVSTSKNESLSGTKLLVVARLTEKLIPDGSTQVVVDTVGAGNGEIVIVSCGSSARQSTGKDHSVIDAAVVGIVDTVETVN
ncbi:microcompartment shell vertex protein GrpN [Rhodospirillum rubrum]|uniref:Bacterial microcompartment shell vertex protein GrpN n=3 Tax=Rhodospirillum rubrum TaxID=1085 RepID=GRPN_RHOR1|nr:EutN/CcmL family microcompartment protein [Rhodospirillum rubrum]P0DUM1.1 RecName: Full=Bacterial microcompartment shell vertex protein GrpN; Short=BMC-P [Rhodospirillum rubrum F11]ABC21713.1 Ethanolamine utilization protein EutN/carboxysome structural protein Ccml [Rhodospirillum rubrum ATCC 11170]AEO47411.1 ethanolamine utilization protein EutN/carboxysome structural protein Ccml [Rhodospirillum rubrum F11]MBK5953266.1 ethanolamine utilization protein EutN [Rhodospirillum rubrum]QXG81375.